MDSKNNNMKIKHVITTLALAGMLGAGAFAGIKASQPVQEAKAATERVYCKCAQSWWKAKNDKGVAGGVGIYAWTEEEGKEKVENASWPGVRMNKVEGDADYWYIDIDTATYKNLIFTRVPESGDVADWGAKTGDLSFQTDGNDLYTITSSSAVWGDPGVAGEWGKYYDLVTDATVYFVDGADWHDQAGMTPSAYAWGGTYNEDYPGTALALTDSRIKIGENWHCVMKATLSGSARQLQFNNGKSGEGEQKTGDLDLNNNGIYFYGVDGKYTPVVQLMNKIEGLMGAATFQEKNYSKSICAIGFTDAKDIVSTYDTLTDSTKTPDAEIRGVTEYSGIYTYDKENNYALGANVSLKAIRDELVRLYPSVLTSQYTIGQTNNSNNVIYIIVAISATTIIALGAMMVIRKRKEDR